MRWSWVITCTLLVAGMTLASGLMHGRMNNRWGIRGKMAAAAQTLNSLPHQFGPWRLHTPQKLDRESIRQLQPAAYVFGTYVNQNTKEAVSMTVLLGPTGVTAVHTPEICMGSQTFKVHERRRPVTVQDPSGQTHEFWSVTFTTTGLLPRLVRVYYGWSTGGPWSAAEDARFAFVGYPYLYKIQLSSPLRPSQAGQSDDACLHFLQDFVPVASQYLVDPASS
ncbi:MAG: exosortase-associated EpsI family protein [Thermoguttaceae bacterium]